MYEGLKARTIGEGKKARPVAVATVNRYMKLLHAVLRLAVKRGLLLTNPAAALELARENNARNRWLSDDEEARLWKALPTWLRPLVTVALHTGCRRGELLRLEWRDIDIEGGTMRLRRDKAGDGRWVVLNPETQAALRSIRRSRKVLSALCSAPPEGNPLALNFKRYWKAAVKTAGIPGFRFHDLRHTMASRLARAGVSPYTIQAAGGWKTAGMMQRYAHLDPATIRAALEQLAAQYPAGRRPRKEANGHQNGHQGASEARAEAAEVGVTA